MTTLDNSYCVPKTKEDWALLGRGESHNFAIKGDRAFYAYDIDEGDNPYRIAMILLKDIGNHDWLTNEIPVPHFLDLVHNRIAPWRLEEVGGEQSEDGNAWLIECGQIICVGFYSDGGVSVSIHYDYASIPAYITTFTDLLTLIKFLTPPAQ